RGLVLDTRDRGALTALVAARRIDTIFDLAAITEPGLSKKEYQPNLEATRSVLAAVTRTDVSRYIFFSTQFVFRQPGALPSAEDDYFPVDYYGESKIESEKEIRATLEPGRYLILRPTYVWGPGLARFRDGLLYRLARGQLLISNSPTAVRYYGFVHTVAAQAIALARIIEPDARYLYYLSDDAIRLRDFCEALRSALGQGHAIAAPPALIRLLGLAGAAVGRLGLRAPITPLQARELTTSFPIPIGPTLEATGLTTDLPAAATETVAWARRDRDWVARISR
ncbi:MAG: NAD-dependent epimerase/dehydratase family protein, partial [Gemmatimonadota bacterium]